MKRRRARAGPRFPGGGARRLGLCWLLAAWAFPIALSAAASDRPSFVVIVADDLGIGDLGCYGGKAIRTPALDRMAAEGVRLTQFYTPAPTCSPARAALLTGRHPLRTGITRVLIPKETQGLPDSEVTLAEHLRDAGYATACIGKWHLGGRKPFRPDRHGFDEFFGVLYSNNMVWLRRLQWPRLELFDGSRSVESPAAQALLTRRYTQRAIDFLRRTQGRPYFLYLAYTMPHIPLAASAEFAGRSSHGPYGDVVEELDASVGHLLSVLSDLEMDGNTVVFFTSDNGPWIGDQSTPGGSTGGLRGFKGMTWEGGLRIPLIVRARGRLPAGESRAAPATLMDLFPTVSSLAGADLPPGRTFDGTDILPILQAGETLQPRELVFSSRKKVSAVRSGPWKLHVRERVVDRKGRPRRRRALNPPLLYRIDLDPGETRDLSAQHPDVVDRLRRSARRFQDGADPAVGLRRFGWAIARGLMTPAP